MNKIYTNTFLFPFYLNGMFGVTESQDIKIVIAFKGELVYQNHPVTGMKASTYN